MKEKILVILQKIIHMPFFMNKLNYITSNKNIEIKWINNLPNQIKEKILNKNV